ncbi:hypothetical protein SEPCBS119000_003479 [Sporothrix epigloea]|uniref:Protein kinase domain-containing protein n=1 Tax=Sporothrix epigloea TaxID=1892477 RepID=A0ABP0DNU4_9PEZI
MASCFLEPKDDEYVFDHSKIILRGPNDEYFYATTEEPMYKSSSIDLDKLEIFPISSDIWPRYSPHLSLAPNPPPPNSYVKKPNFVNYDENTSPQKIGDLILQEADICEILKKHPHPNVATYMGCVVQDDKIKGLCFARYAKTLSERLEMKTPFDKQRCLEEIESGIRHLHSLGLVHNDINPANIMLDDADRAVIIDFDSCQHEGEELGKKAGAISWSIEDATHARHENDFFGVSKLKEHLQL